MFRFLILYAIPKVQKEPIKFQRLFQKLHLMENDETLEK